ncbi:MAG: hypothetical protein NT014_05520 [Candidatus Omnitrophica bacterium]|nr:hypothetical protein [Candidatus Omnitrophota bacterium]
MILNLSGCALTSGVTTAPVEVNQRFNVSYIQVLVMVKNALKTEQVQFEKALINKDTIRLKGNYPDGRVIQFVISKIGNSGSNITVLADTGGIGKKDAQKVLATILQYSKQGK